MVPHWFKLKEEHLIGNHFAQRYLHMTLDRSPQKNSFVFLFCKSEQTCVIKFHCRHQFHFDWFDTKWNCIDHNFMQFFIHLNTVAVAISHSPPSKYIGEYTFETPSSGWLNCVSISNGFEKFNFDDFFYSSSHERTLVDGSEHANSLT